MRLLETWVQTRLADALGWTLLHSLWEGAIVAFALAAVFLTTRSPRARYAAACIAMLVIVGCFGITLISVLPEGAPEPRSRAFGVSAWNVRTGVDALGNSNPGLAPLAPWLALFWMAGVCVFSLAHTASWISVCRMRRRGVCCVSEYWEKQLAGLSAELRLSRPVRLLASCLVEAPLVLGHVRPVILMPIGLLAGLPAGQIEAILLHELAHIRRYDYLVNAVQRFVEGLLFYHPAIWWISRLIRAERENCCDDVVVATRGHAHEYAAALAALEQNRWSAREPAVAATGGSLVKRIRRLLYPEGPNGTWAPLSAGLILMATAAMTLTAWQAVPSQKGGAAAAKEGERPETSPYEAWLNQDVVYIIADEERAAFQKLTSDDELQKFIEQFWLRRDPTPGTTQNEFKEEHYRRIAYANVRFGTTGRSGWRTDRGRMYIVYGPPDEIESHPSGRGPTVAPFEVWKYRYVEGIGNDLYFTFVDRMRTGDYRLA